MCDTKWIKAVTHLQSRHTPVSRGRRSTDRGQWSVIQGYVSANANASWLIFL